jgi:hypothetical protein
MSRIKKPAAYSMKEPDEIYPPALVRAVEGSLLAYGQIREWPEAAQFNLLMDLLGGIRAAGQDVTEEVLPDEEESVTVLVCRKCYATSVDQGPERPAGKWWSRAHCRGGHDPVRYIPAEIESDDPWVCEKCGQLLAGPAALCNSGIHVGPGDGEEAQGEAVRLSESGFDEATILPHRHDWQTVRYEGFGTDLDTVKALERCRHCPAERTLPLS